MKKTTTKGKMSATFVMKKKPTMTVTLRKVVPAVSGSKQPNRPPTRKYA